jgi:indole-3-glycerol phosphate synthase
MHSIPDILKKIVATKKVEVLELVKDIQRIKQEATAQKSPLDFKKAIYPNPKERTIIAEVKKASPSAGIISASFNPASIAKEYEKGKANAISVLTDKEYFKGDNCYLREVKSNTTIPVLRKDFIITPEQIIETRAIGADSFLLISTILSTMQLSEFILMGRELNMEPLVEIHDENDLEKAIKANADIIGINNRNLRNFTVNIETTKRLIPLIPSNKIIVAESGIKSLETASLLYNVGADSLLIGEFLMRTKNKALMIRQIKNT